MLTTTLNEKFAFGVFVVTGAGFFLNDSMDDFSAGPNKPMDTTSCRARQTRSNPASG